MPQANGPEITPVLNVPGELSTESETVRTIAALMESERKYRGLLEAAPDAMVVVDQDGKIVLLNLQAEKQFGYRRDELVSQKITNIIPIMLHPDGFIVSWNEGAERIKGYRAEEIIGQHFSRFYPAEDIREGIPSFELEQATKNERFEDKGWRLRKDGSRFLANIVITALRDEQGQLRGFGKLTRDLTERRQSEDHLMKAMEKLKCSNGELEQFAYVASHDLQEPLRMVASFIQLLARRYKGRLDADADEFIAFAVDGTGPGIPESHWERDQIPQ